MNFFLFRNTTIEFFFDKNFCFSGYNEITIKQDIDVYIWFYLLPIKTNNDELKNEIETYYNTILFIHDSLPKEKPFIIFTLHNIYPIKYVNNDFSINHAINCFNSKIIELAQKNSNIKIIDFSNFIINYSNNQLINWKYFFVSKTLINPQLATDFKVWFSKQLNSLLFIRKKCIVLDLDNTVWGGIIGEDGINEIKIGGDYPGNAFLLFQESIVELSKNGIIIAICSKNNEKDVIEVFRKNPFMKLKEEHITSYRINWKNKADNIKEIAEELNIGLDSLVFIDDNPTERELVKQLLPMIEVPDFPTHPYLLPVFFNKLLEDFFNIYSLTNEDKNKIQQYKKNIERKELQNQFSDISDYLRSLNIVITIQNANQFNIPRIAQLTQKTNQFNLTTKRYTELEIKSMINTGSIIYCINVEDKFGDNGITGAIILNKENEMSYKIDTLLLSCRILGKGIEKVFLYYVIKELKRKGIKKIIATYMLTYKNEQVSNFYDKMGFHLINKTNEIKTYILETSNQQFEIENYYTIKEL